MESDYIISLSIHVYLFYLSTDLSIYLSTDLSIYLSTDLSIHYKNTSLNYSCKTRGV